MLTLVQAQFEARYAAEQEMLRNEAASLTEHLDTRSAELRRQQNTIESYKLSNDELSVSKCSAWISRIGIRG